jgi:DNA primase large subunit
MHKFKIYKYYMQEELLNYWVEFSRDREVVGTYESGSYTKRPWVINYPGDVEEKVREGVVAFHCSVERWKNPMLLSPELDEKQIAELRKGWDVIIDIDSKTSVEHAKVVARVVLEFLKDYGVNASVKFSGRRGFHIGISWNAIPEKINFQSTRELYPQLLRDIASFIREKIKDYAFEELVKYEGGYSSLIKKLSVKSNEINLFSFVEIEKDWGVRHLFRMPFSINEKTMLVSIPVKNIGKFSPDDAKIENVDKKSFEVRFLDNKDLEATELVVAVLDWAVKRKVEEIDDVEVREEVKRELRMIKKRKIKDESLFPPCIRRILEGLEDGRERSIFTLVTFLKNMGWSNEEIEKRMFEWNKKNKPPLRESLIRTHLKWHFRQRRNLLPANCTNELFYKSIGVCNPDEICKLVKNPVTYPFKKWKIIKSREKE